MPVPIGRGEVQALAAEDAVLLDVLDPAEFARSHLPGAHNLPAAGLVPERLAGLDPEQPIVVYSHDLQCDLSPRAARLLERHGFGAVHDYEAGKADWLAYGLPFEGDGPLLAGQLLRPCLCAPAEEPVGDVRRRIAEVGAAQAVVVDAGDIVLGVAMPSALAGAPCSDPVEAHMVPCPRTFRPTAEASAVTRWLVGRGTDEALVTTASGRLLGRVSDRDLRDPSLSKRPRQRARAGSAARILRGGAPVPAAPARSAPS